MCVCVCVCVYIYMCVSVRVCNETLTSMCRNCFGKVSSHYTRILFFNVTLAELVEYWVLSKSLVKYLWSYREDYDFEVLRKHSVIFTQSFP